MSPISRWVIGAHLFLGAWVFFAYICWLDIDPTRKDNLPDIWRKVRLTFASILLMVLMYVSLTLMGNTHLIPRHHTDSFMFHLFFPV